LPKRSIIYIDGFNLFYGALKGTKYKWLNLERYFTLLRQDDNIQEIKYFTAMLDGHKKLKQEIYLLALETLPKVNIYFGKFKTKKVNCTIKDCNHSGDRLFNVPEEKRTDVNIAIHMLNDAVTNKCERLVLVSGDSDLVPALNMIKNVTPQKEIIVYIPARSVVRGAAVELRGSADKDRILPNSLLAKSQFPQKIPDGMGGTITKPEKW